MFQETENGYRDFGPVLIGGQEIDFAEIFSQGGQAHLETAPGSGKFIDIDVNQKKILLEPSTESPYFFRAEIDIFGALIFNVVMEKADSTGKKIRDPDLPHAQPLVALAI